MCLILFKDNMWMCLFWFYIAFYAKKYVENRIPVYLIICHFYFSVLCSVLIVCICKTNKKWQWSSQFVQTKLFFKPIKPVRTIPWSEVYFWWLDRNPKCNSKYHIRSGLGFWLYKSKKLENFQKYACRSVQDK